MNLFHTDPLKLAAMSIKEYDRQTGQHTVALLHSTTDKSEHDRIVTALESKIKSLNGKVDRIGYDNSLLELDNKSLVNQAQPYFTLRDEHGIEAIDLTLSRKKMLDKYCKPYEEKIQEHVDEIKTLRENLRDAEKRANTSEGTLSTMEESYEDHLTSLQITIDEYEEGVPKTRRLKSIKLKKPRAPRASRAALQTNTVVRKMHMFTKKDYSINALKFSSSTTEKNGFKYKGFLQLITSTCLTESVTKFAKEMGYDAKEGVIMADPSVNVASVEDIYCKFISKNISKKQTKYGYDISPTDSLCRY
jgi:TolA-binding protein